ncbi:oligosaccharide flippase family protein [Bacillus luteolus]|uniref:Oligosaccharide flippase family protein n=1 Tax=Litchfieldia luteola TaxID=682179 RepID=A0ABR9QFF3_9BACI|nr:oligosaccharide flippase family protein [Cytobacillus luteolus]MBE4907225.1 oligosaccharide flippase family protein [Cytobacillus luteolus]MBP1943299.1 O-antigen/teichoic acid export membrane protein [Cytobacillus luteolus]
MNSKKQLSINLIANIMSFSISIGVSFLLTPFLIKHIGKEAYGFFPLANNFVMYINLVVIALNSMAARFIMLEIMRKDDEKASIYFNSVFYSNIILVVLLSVPLCLVVLFIDRLLNVPHQLLNEVQILFSLIFLTFLITVLGSVFNVATLAVNRIDLRSYQDIIQSGLKAVLFIGFFSLFTPSIFYVGVVSLCVCVIGTFISIYLTKRLLPKLLISLSYFNIHTVKELLSSGIWVSFNQLSVVLLIGFDLLIANLFFGASKAGEYSIAQTVPAFLVFLISMIAGVFVPPMAARYADNDINGLVREIRFSSKVLSVLISVPISGFIVFGDEFYRLWVPGENAEYLHYLSIIMMGPYLINGSISTLFNVNTILNKVKLPSIILFISGVLNILLLFILLKFTNLGLLAIPICSSSISVLRNLIFTPIYPAKCLGVEWHKFYSLLIRNIITTVILVCLFSLLKEMIPFGQWSIFILTVVGCGLLGYIISLFTTLNSKEISRCKILVISRLLQSKKLKESA